MSDEQDKVQDELRKYYLTSKGKAIVDHIVASYAKGDSIQQIANELGMDVDGIRIMMAIDAAQEARQL